MAPNGFCAPDRIDHWQKTGSCLKPDEARRVVEEHNRVAPAHRRISTNQDFKNMVHELRAKLPKECKGAEHCLVRDSRFAKHVQESFRPAKPDEWNENDREWLSTDDIVMVMKQYERAYTDFEFVGVFPINFAERIGEVCVSTRICDVPALVERLVYGGKKHFGIVFNLDRHDQGGSHWVAMYGSLDPSRRAYGIYFYDSVAVPPKKEFRVLMAQMQAYVHEHVRPQTERHFCKQYNKHRRQYKNTECGVFCMVFLINSIERGNRVHFRRVCIDIKDDDQTHRHRYILYTP